MTALWFDPRLCVGTAVVFGIVASFGCATRIPVKKEIGSLDLRYTVTGQAKPSDKVVAIVSPIFSAAESGAPGNAPQLRSSNPLIAAALAQAVASFKPFIGQATYAQDYQPRLTEAMVGSIQEIVSSKGFRTKGPYSNFDDIPFGDKKSIYLVAVPSLKVYIDQRQEFQDCRSSGLVCRETGSIQITGELLYKMIEPLTNQALMTKRVNLSDFGIRRSYVHESQVRQRSGDLIRDLADKAMAPTELSDNTDRVMTEAVNEFFQKAMAKIETFISREELLSFEADIQQLKGMKRF